MTAVHLKSLACVPMLSGGLDGRQAGGTHVCAESQSQAASAIFIRIPRHCSLAYLEDWSPPLLPPFRHLCVSLSSTATSRRQLVAATVWPTKPGLHAHGQQDVILMLTIAGCAESGLCTGMVGPQHCCASIVTGPVTGLVATPWDALQGSQAGRCTAWKQLVTHESSFTPP